MGSSAVLGIALVALLLLGGLPVDSGPTNHSVPLAVLAQMGSSANATVLTISSFTATPSTVLILAPLEINTTVQGGVSPFSYWYNHLPPGCVSENVSGFTCYPRDAQHYMIEVTVNDSAGGHANATTNLTVKNGFGLPPEISYFRAWPSPGKVGSITYLNANATSRSGTPTSVLSFAYLGLPLGCATFNQTNLSCIPAEPGTFQIWVRVTDGYAQFSQTSLNLTVTGTASTNGSSPPQVGTTEILFIGLGIVVFAALVGALFLIRRRPKSPAAVDPSEFPITGVLTQREPPPTPSSDFRPPPGE